MFDQFVKFAGTRYGGDYATMIRPREGIARHREVGAIGPGQDILLIARGESEVVWANARLSAVSVSLPSASLRALGAPAVRIPTSASTLSHILWSTADRILHARHEGQFASSAGHSAVGNALRELMSGILQLIPRGSVTGSGWYTPIGLVQIENTIELHFRNPELSTTGLAERLGISARSLNRRTVEAGTTPHALITARRVREAEHLLSQHPERTNAEVAAAVGFPSTSTMRRSLARFRLNDPHTRSDEAAQLGREIA